MADGHVSFKAATGNPGIRNPAPLHQPEPAQEPGNFQPASERVIGLLNSHNPRDLLAKSQEVLSFLTASFANKWDSDMSQEEISGLYWVLDSVENALGRAREQINQGG